MKHINEYFDDLAYEKVVLCEKLGIINEEYMVCEAFKSSILQALAKEIYRVEKDRNQREIENAKRLDKEYPTGYKHKPNIKSFSTFFGPIEISNRYGGTGKFTQGLKWSEITDEDFKLYAGDDKELVKLIKQAYGKKINADFICCEKGKKTPLYVIQAYKKEDERVVWQFTTTWGGEEFNKKEAKAYKYSYRNLRADEAIDLVKDLDVYALVITPDMVQKYQEIIDARKVEKQGMISYDKASLEKMLKDQKARYSALVKEIKAKKLMEDPNILFEEIEETHEEAVKVLKLIMSKPEFMDHYYAGADFMRTVSYCYEEFYKYAKSCRDADKEEASALKSGASPEEAKKWRKYEDQRSQENIRSAKKYMQEVKKELEEIKAKLNA